MGAPGETPYATDDLPAAADPQTGAAAEGMSGRLSNLSS